MKNWIAIGERMSVCKHGYTSVFGVHRIICPFCEIDRLRKELEEAREFQAGWEITALAADEQWKIWQEKAEAAERKLASYEGAVEVEKEVRPAGINGKRYGMLYLQMRKEWIGQRVRVLVLKGER